MQSDRELFLEFQRKWNKEKVQNMSLEEYTGLYEGFTEPKQNVENFTYQIQGRTTKVKNKWSDSYHFGIYKYKSKIKNEKNKNKNDFMIYDDKYVWNKKYGNTAQEAFENIKSKILKIIEFSQNNELEKIDNVDLGDEFKWEIAFRYQNPDDMRILDIFNTEIIETLYKDNFGFNLKNISEFHRKNLPNIRKFTLEEVINIHKSYIPTLEFNPVKNNKKDILRNDYENFKDEINDITLKGKIMKNFPLNQILYGPPGTGKTYEVVNLALQILGESPSENRKAKFDKYRQNGQIEFITFHQSYGYEEFVEGIKPVFDDKQTGELKYEIRDGIFKEICERAEEIKFENDKSALSLNGNEDIWKMSLGNSQNSDEDFVFDECIKRGIVALGFGNKIDISDCKDDNDIHKKIDDENEKKKFDATALDRLKNKIKIGDLILISYGNTKIRAIARVTGEYEKIDDEIMEDFVQTRKVEWIFLPNEPFSYNKILNKKLSQMSIYKIKNNVKFDDLRELFNKDETKTSKKYILIIDEINRGNISKIFGELITLIEESKRIGNSEELRVALPYSGKKFDNGKGFGVPKNLYIIGTMNTADRSIALIDTALRRRFEFVEMMPKAGLLKDEKNEPLMIESVNLQELLKAMNERIEFLLDREHTIGHAYFIGVANLSDLRKAFKNKIIPLLQEYFYDDYEKIRAVLNDNGMITDKPKPKFNGEFSFIDDGKMVYQICKFDELYDEKFIEICKKIYE